MYVCNCHKVTERQITQAMDQGAKTLTAIQLQLKVGTNCGSCLEHAQMVMQEFNAKPSLFNYDLATQLS